MDVLGKYPDSYTYRIQYVHTQKPPSFLCACADTHIYTYICIFIV